MAYAHCHNCDWGQDDFWDENYNPVRFLLQFEDELLNDDLEKEVVSAADREEIDGVNAPMTRRELIAEEIWSAAEKVMNMQYRTDDEFQAAGRICPQCGDKLDVD